MAIQRDLTLWTALTTLGNKIAPGEKEPRNDHFFKSPPLYGCKVAVNPLAHLVLVEIFQLVQVGVLVQLGAEYLGQHIGNDRKRRAILAARGTGQGINKIASKLGVGSSTVRQVIAYASNVSLAPSTVCSAASLTGSPPES